ncbi:MAG: GyrI-like domain-containing protein [Defluviitaleaceae bacterium]|nr:GyrI-like domain-containing protein [Defluviitaleaceae bacterium]
MNGEPTGLFGLSMANESGDGGYYYICVVTDKPAPRGMFETIIPKHNWAIFSGEGKPSTIASLFNRIYSEWQPTSGYKWADMIDVEVYLDNSPEDMRYEVWMPVVKKTI